MSYAILDSGGGRKLEQVGPYVVERQAATAFWRPRLPDARWKEAVAVHHREQKGGGHWEHRGKVPESWTVRHGGLDLLVRLTPFGHVGLFAEHVEQWAWMDSLIRGAGRPIRVLNLFAYTGGASLACARAGARVTHCDAAKGIVDWARKNAEANRVDTVSWVVEDVNTFVARELRRGSRYHGILLDPPTYGRGAKGELWAVEDHLVGLLDKLTGLLEPDPLFFLLSCHTPGFGGRVLDNLLVDALGSRGGESAHGEMCVTQADGRLLPSGSFARRSW